MQVRYVRKSSVFIQKIIKITLIDWDNQYIYIYIATENLTGEHYLFMS